MTADLHAAAVRVLARYGDRLDPPRVADEVLAAMLPDHRRQVLAEAVEAVEGLKPSVKRFWDTNDAIRVLALNGAIRMLRGLAAEPVGPDRPRGVAVIEPITFTAGIDEARNGDEGTEVYAVVLRIGQWEVARWPVNYSERDYLDGADEMEQFVAAKLAALFKAEVTYCDSTVCSVSPTPHLRSPGCPGQSNAGGK